VGQLLDLGALVDARDSDGLTALCRAAERNLEQVVCVLLDRDADADVTCGERMVTPLHLAVEARAESIVAQLRARGANLEAKDGHGRTPRDLAIENNYMGHETLFVPPHAGAASAAFLAAVKHGRAMEVRRWISRGVDITAQDSCCYTALTLATQGNHEEVVQSLLDSGGAIVNQQDAKGHTALWWAAWYGYHNLVLALLEKRAQVDLSDATGQDPLGAALSRGWMEVALALIEAKNTAESREVEDDEEGDKDEEESERSVQELPNDEGRICEAVWFEDIATVRRFLRLGLDPESKNHYGSTPLQAAAAINHVAMIELLLDNGASTETPTKDTTPLWTAVMGESSSPEAAVMLLSRGASVNARCEETGQTPLIGASSSDDPGKVEIIRQLIDYGADLEAVDEEGNTALLSAVSWGSGAAISALLAAGAKAEAACSDGEKPLFRASTQGRTLAARLLLEAGVDVLGVAPGTELHITGTSALVAAVRGGFRTLVELLITHGADINRCGPGGEPALFDACRTGSGPVVKALIDNGADVDMSTPDGQTALSIAQKNGRDEVVRMLMQAGNAKKASHAGSVAYSYPPLPGTSHIRVLYLHPGQEGEMISVELYEVSLDKGPVYEALSYEWGEKSGSIPIRCGAHCLLVTPNLWETMQRLRLKDEKRTL